VLSTTLATQEGFCEPPLTGDGMQRYMNSYAAEMRAFVSVVRGETPPAVSHHDIRMSALIADASRESLRTGSVIHLKVDYCS